MINDKFWIMNSLGYYLQGKDGNNATFNTNKEAQIEANRMKALYPTVNYITVYAK